MAEPNIMALENKYNARGMWMTDTVDIDVDIFGLRLFSCYYVVLMVSVSEYQHWK